jgi:hypothetical protein
MKTLRQKALEFSGLEEMAFRALKQQEKWDILWKSNGCPKLTEAQLGKSIFGVIESFSDLFEDWGYSRDVETSPVTTPRPRGYYFLASEYERVETWLGRPASKGNLSVKPTEQVEKEVCDASTDAEFQSFHLIPWASTGLALVTANDCRFIAAPWVGFVPLESIPEINPGDTKILEV